ncbi:MAG: hypothetical protein FWB72_04515, partial [Firmicutes bacterium]|nr:hypothetical protein [Bacillota bacterium]
YEPTPCPVPCPEPCPECNKYDCKGECQKDCTEPYEPYEPKPCPEPCERCGKYDCYDYYCNRECTEPYEPTPCPVPCPVPCPKPCPDCNEYDCKGECQKDCKEPYEPKPCPTPCPEPCEICGEYYCDGNCEPYEPTPCPVPCPEPCATCGYYPCICASVQIIFICDQFLWEALVSISIANVAGFSFTSLAIPFENNARVNLNYYYDAQFAGWNFNGELITALSQSFFANSNIIVIVSEWTPICLGNHPVYVPCNLVEINEDVRTVAAIGTIIGLTSLVYASDKIRARRRDKRLEKELVS